MVRINWTLLAVDDLRSIHEYISRDSQKYAKIQVVKIRSRTKVLLTNPEIGRVVPEIGQKDIRELHEGNYRIVYKLINKSRIDILTIHHQSRDFKKSDI